MSLTKGRKGERARGRVGVMAFLLAACSPPPEVPIEPPQSMNDSTPFVYPVELWDQNVSGQTILLLRISELGVVDSVMIATPSGHDQFDSAAVQGARTMKFTPGRQGERRVAMWTKLPVRFARDTVAMGLGNDDERP
jgi:TonB family protein